MTGLIGFLIKIIQLSRRTWFQLKKTLRNRRLVSQKDNFGQDYIFGVAESSGKQNVVVTSGPADQQFTFKNNDRIPTTKEKTANGQTSEGSVTDRIDKEKCIIVETVEDRFQNALLTAIDDIIPPRIE